MHLAAESHVDRSIDGPGAFIDTNVTGTFVLLEAARCALGGARGEAKARFRFHHVSTDEVFGSLGAEGFFHEDSPYQPNSPYSASKAGSDHLVRAWHHTYGLPTVASNCSNNYGPYHFPEKLIPLVILNALEGKPLPVYGTGANIRDWLYVEDHARALVEIATKGKRSARATTSAAGTSGRNIDVVEAICDLVDEMAPSKRRDRPARRADHLRDRPARPRRALRHRRDEDQARARLDATRRRFETGLAQDGALVSRQPAPGGAGSGPASIAASGWARRGTPRERTRQRPIGRFSCFGAAGQLGRMR